MPWNVVHPSFRGTKHTTIRGFYVDDSFIIHGRHIKKQSDRHDRRVVMLIWLCVCVFYLHIELMSSRCVLEKSLRVPEIKLGFRFWASSSATICFHVPRHSCRHHQQLSHHTNSGNRKHVRKAWILVFRFVQKLWQEVSWNPLNSDTLILVHIHHFTLREPPPILSNFCHTSFWRKRVSSNGTLPI